MRVKFVSGPCKVTCNSYIQGNNYHWQSSSLRWETLQSLSSILSVGHRISRQSFQFQFVRLPSASPTLANVGL